MAQLEDPVNEVVPVYTYQTEPDAAEKAKLVSEGLILVNMNGETLTSGIEPAFAYFFDAGTGNLSSWVADINSGLVKNQSELYPFQTTILEQNPGLEGEQLPTY
jgi:hypothetical protein